MNLILKVFTHYEPKNRSNLWGRVSAFEMELIFVIGRRIYYLPFTLNMREGEASERTGKKLSPEEDLESWWHNERY